ncbi:MAG TPA: hypothetical protein VFO21_02290 [Vicinamibacterales bacterium]|nr:hypothetical protein [Vicinamibacterales bacterium]
MIRPIQIVVVASLLMVHAATAEAQISNRLELVIQRSNGVESLTLLQIGADYEGTLTRNGTPHFVFATYSGNVFVVQLGSSYSNLIFAPVSSTEGHYLGDFDNGTRPISITRELTANGRRVIFEGTVGAFDDITATVQEQSLRLFWDDSKLTLFRGENGACFGEIRRRGESSAVTCASSGTLMDALFSNSDLFMGFLVNLLVR